LVELLLAVTYLGLCASSILGCITASAQKMKEVEQRRSVLNYVTSLMEGLAASTRRPGAASLTNVSNVTIPGIANQVQITRKIEAVAGHTDVFYIETTAVWTVSSTKTNRQQQLTLSTYVRTPYG
jgi:hypothetical protein